MSSNRTRYDNKSNDKKGSILTIKNSEQEPERRNKSATMYANKKQLSTQQNNKPKEKSVAMARWKILKEAIFDKSNSFHNSRASVRRFDSFGFLRSVKVQNSDVNTTSYKPQTKSNNNHRFYNSNNVKSTNYVVDDTDSDDEDVCVSNKDKSKTNTSKDSENYEWYDISLPSVDMDSVKVRFYSGPIGLKDMMGFNNTGNVCLWPSEEVMTYFCIKNSAIFDDKSVCELGGGMTCLGGLMISRCSQSNEVFLTDGNESSFENLEVICSNNEFRCSVECCLLQWSKETNYGDLESRFDYIICADCLFFDEFREDLCATIWKLLKMDGTCLIFAPNRQNTFHKFVDMAKLHFECMIVHDYDMEVWERHLYEKENNPDYDEDLHYPLLLKLKKRKRTTNDFCKMVL